MRLQCRLKQKEMSLRQADLLEAWFQKQSWTSRVTVHERTGCVILYYTGARETVLQAVRQFSWKQAEQSVSLPAHSSRMLNRQFEEKLVGKAALKLVSTLFLPTPLRIARVLWHAVPFLRKGLRCLRQNKIKVELLDAVSMFDDEIMELYLGGEEVPQAKIRAAIRKATIAVQMVPVTCGTSYKNKGVQELLDAIVDFMPSPLDKKGIAGVNPKTDEEDFRPADDNAPFSALAFKIATDPYVGKLCFFRVYSGTLKAGQSNNTAFFYCQIDIAKTFSTEILQFQDYITQRPFFIYILIRVFLSNHHTCNIFWCSILYISGTYKFSISEYGISV